MKVRKLLALVLTLLLVLAYGAFAAEGEAAQEPGQQAATAQPAQQEAAATQAFERSLAVKGIFVWEWNWTQSTANTGVGAKTISNLVWQSFVMNLVYKVTKDVRIEATVFNAYRWGEPSDRGVAGTDGRSGTNAFVPNAYDFPDNYGNMGGSEIAAYTYTTATGDSVTAISAKNLIRLEEIQLVWNVGGFVNDIYVGRMTNPWGFAGGLMLGARAGVDRIKWVGKTKMFGYMALPIFFVELRSDISTKLQGDERILIEPALVLVGPGKFIEVLGITWAYDGLRKSKGAAVDSTTGDPATAALASYNLVGLSMKMRAGSLAVINFEFIGIMGRNDASATKIAWGGSGMALHTRLDMAKIFLNADINVSMLTFTPEFAFVTAPNVDAAVGVKYYEPTHRAGNIGFATQYYQVGGILLNAAGITHGTGWYLGLFSAALKVKANLLGGTLVPWLKFSWATTVSQYNLVGANAAVATYQKQATKGLGFEIDLGVDITLTDGLILKFDFGFLILPDDIKNGLKLSDYSGKKNPMCIDVKLLFKF